MAGKVVATLVLLCGCYASRTDMRAAAGKVKNTDEVKQAAADFQSDIEGMKKVLADFQAWSKGMSNLRDGLPAFCLHRLCARSHAQSRTHVVDSILTRYLKHT